MEFRVTSWAGGGEQINESFKLDIEEPTLLKPAFTAWKEQKKSIVVDLTGKELEGWLNYRNAKTGVTVFSKDDKWPSCSNALHFFLKAIFPFLHRNHDHLKQFSY